MMMHGVACCGCHYIDSVDDVFGGCGCCVYVIDVGCVMCMSLMSLIRYGC